MARSAALRLLCLQVALLRTKIFYPEMLESPYNQYLQAKTFVEAMQTKSAVLVALAPLSDMAMVASADLVVDDGGPAAAVAYVTNVCVLAEAWRQ